MNFNGIYCLLGIPKRWNVLKNLFKLFQTTFRALLASKGWDPINRGFWKIDRHKCWSASIIGSVLFILTSSYAREGSCWPLKGPHHGHLPALVMWSWPAPEAFLEQNKAASTSPVFNGLKCWVIEHKLPQLLPSPPPPHSLRGAVSILRNDAECL